jgi:phage gp29-like protein
MATRQSSILGPDGDPFEIEIADQEISGVSAIAGRPPYAGHLAFGISPQRLGAILRAADAGNTLEWNILAEEIEELFPHYFAVLSKRRRQVTQLPISVIAASSSSEHKKHRDFVQDWLDTDVLQEAMFDIVDAIGKGFSVSEIMWETKPDGIRPAAILNRAQRFFEFDWWNGETIWMRMEGGFQDLTKHKFLVHRHRSKSGQPHRSGLTRAVCWLWMYSAFTIKDWAIFVQAYGFPIRVGRYGPEASGKDKGVLWRAVSSIAGDVATIIPRSTEIEFVTDGDRAAGSTLYEKRADWFDREVSKLVLGGTAGTDAISGGHAVGREHRSAEQDVERFDARLLSVSLTRQIAQVMIAFTFGPQDEYARILVGQEEKAPLEQVISAVADLGAMGFKVKASELRERLDLTDPVAGDEIVGGVPPAPEPQPDIPRPAVQPPETQTRLFAPVTDLILAHAEVPEEIVQRMSARLASEAEGALAGLTETIRGAFDAAEDMQDLQRRLDKLDLPKKEYALAMQRAIALSNIVGQASVISELGRR